MKKFLAFLIFGVIIIHYSFSDSHLIPTKKVVTESFDSTPEPESVGIKVALLLDTSNSMDGLIAQAKAQLWQIVNELSLAKYGGKNPHLKIALYEYGNDGLEQSDGYLRKVLDFGNDLDLISEKLFALKTNGGSEYCGTVIQKSLDELAWGKNEQDLNLIFIAGNEPFTQGNVSYKDATTHAKEKNVIVNTIFCGNYQEGIHSFWQQGALLTGGDYSAIDHNVVQVYIVTPYDQQIIILNQQLNDTYIYYGNQGYQKLEMQKVQDENAAQMSEAVIVNRAVSKSKAIYNNNSWDLVDASKEKDFDLKKIEKEDLPEELKSKTNAELESYIKEQTAKRADIQKQIDALNVQRNQYLASQQKNDKTENLENAMLSTIRKQAENKRYTFE